MASFLLFLHYLFFNLCTANNNFVGGAYFIELEEFEPETIIIIDDTEVTKKIAYF